LTSNPRGDGPGLHHGPCNATENRAPAGMAAMFPDSGSYMVHWHLMDGQWKIASLVVNSMKPLPGMEAMMAPAPAQ